MINYLLLLLFFIPSIQQGSGEKWTSKELKSANTGKEVTYMTDEEKTVLQYMNLARMYPKRYLSIGLYNKEINKKGSKYHKSLINTLKTMEPKAALEPSEEMNQLARCLAKEQSKSGKIGHQRKRCERGYSAECCSYSYDGPEKHVMLLLIDQDVPSLGHREIILSEDYSSAGVAMDSHKEYGTCTVIDFR